MTNTPHFTNVIRAVLFDFDGTLTEPGSIDFDLIRRKLGCPPKRPVLEFIASMTSAAEKEKAGRILEEFEAGAALKSRPNAGAEDLVDFLNRRGLKTGILSRNCLASIITSLGNFDHIRQSDFAVILSRDDPFSPKPSPDGILAAAAMLGVDPAELLVVGDFVFDIEAGHRAGAVTCFLTNRDSSAGCTTPPDFTVSHLGELQDIIRIHAPLPPGKLPNDMLDHFLKAMGEPHASLLVAPGIGEDIAALPLAGEEVLVLKSDPITFTSQHAGIYAVTVNVNDIATAGAEPRWMLASLLFPVGTHAAAIGGTMQELHEAARSQGLILCGGHTEITDAVTRPVIAAQIAGTVSRSDLLLKQNIREGDRILLTKKLAVEGTSILAHELPDRLRTLGFDEEELERCRNFIANPGLSVLAEARIAAGTAQVSAMHDVTEGGLATAVEELSRAGRHRIRIRRDQIPVYPETMKMCKLLGISPLGLIGSGSLLIACRADAAKNLKSALEDAGIAAVVIGEVLDPGTGVEATDESGKRLPWPVFENDELARLFESVRRADPAAGRIESDGRML